MKEVKVKFPGTEEVKRFCNTAGKFDFDVDVIGGTRRYVVDAKSLLGVLSLDLSKPVTLNIYERGEEVDRFLEAINEFLVK